jgi:predicted DNA-binding transcriptional regulator AlpA
MSERKRHYPSPRTPAECAELPDEALVSDPEICAFAKISRTNLWRRRKEGDIPPPLKIGPRMNRTPMRVVRQFVRGD